MLAQAQIVDMRIWFCHPSWQRDVYAYPERKQYAQSTLEKGLKYAHIDAELLWSSVAALQIYHY